MGQTTLVFEEENCRVHKIGHWKYIPECLVCKWSGRIFSFAGYAKESFDKHWEEMHSGKSA